MDRDALHAQYVQTIGPLGGARATARDFLEYATRRQSADDDRRMRAASQSAAGTRALLASHPAAVGRPAEVFADTRWIEPGLEQPSARLDDALSVLALGALAHIQERRQPLKLEALLAAAFGDDDASRLVRAGVLGRTVPPDFAELPDLPGWDDVPPGFRDTLDKLERYAKLRDIIDALRDLGEALSSTSQTEPIKLWRHQAIGAVRSPHADFPLRACPGDLVTIRRAAEASQDFGSQPPANVLVVFQLATGTLISAEVVAGGWSPDAVTVRVPAVHGRVCIGFIETDAGSSGGSGGGSVSAAASRLVDAISHASPGIGAWAAGAFGGMSPPSQLRYTQSICLSDVNRLHIGPPRILSFELHGLEAGRQLGPRQAFRMEWSVENADRIEIRAAFVGPAPGRGIVPPAPPAGLLPASGSASLAPMEGLTPCRIRYTLEAANTPCGSNTRAFDVDYRGATVALVFMGGGTRSAFDLGVIEYLARALPRAPSIFAGSGFGAVSALFGGTDLALGRVNATRAQPHASQLATFWEAVTTWTAFDTGALPGPPLGTRSPEEMIDTLSEKIVYTIGVTVTEFVFDQVKDLVKEQLLDGLAASIGKGASSALGPVAIAAVAAIKLTDLMKKIAEAIGSANYKAALHASVSTRNPAALRALLAAAPAGLPPDVRIAVPLVDLPSGELFYANAAGTLRRFTPGASTFPAVGTPLSRTALLTAATTLPGRYPAFTPSGSTTRMFVDGGLRDPVPIPAAIREGAEHVIVVSPNGGVLSAGLPSGSGNNFMQTMERGATIREFAEARRAIRPFEGWVEMQPYPVPVEFIEASLPIHEASVTDPGLVAIMRDYGYMRAFDMQAPPVMLSDPSATDSLRDVLRETSDRITTLRVSAWRLENDMEAMSLEPPPIRLRDSPRLVPVRDGTGVESMRDAKRLIHSLLVERATAVRNAYVQGGRQAWPETAVPPGWESWFERFERHPFPVGVVRASPAFGDPEDPNVFVPASPWTSLTTFRVPSNGVDAAAMPDRSQVAVLLSRPP